MRFWTPMVETRSNTRPLMMSVIRRSAVRRSRQPGCRPAENERNRKLVATGNDDFPACARRKLRLLRKPRLRLRQQAARAEEQHQQQAEADQKFAQRRELLG